MKALGLHIVLYAALLFPLPEYHDIQEDLAVIVHESVDTGTIDKDDLLEIYTLNKQNWRDDSRIIVSDYKGNSDLRRAFYDELGTSVNSVKRIWLRAQFTGRTLPPSIVKSVDEMIKKVIERPGTVGYVPLSQVPEGVRVIMEISHE